MFGPKASLILIIPNKGVNFVNKLLNPINKIGQCINSSTKEKNNN